MGYISLVPGPIACVRVVCVVLSLLVLPRALAQPDVRPSAADVRSDGDGTAVGSDLSLIQSFSSKQFGHLRAPLSWQIEETASGTVRVIEGRAEGDSSAPVALIEISRLNPPEGIGTQALLEALIQELDGQFGGVEVLKREAHTHNKNKGFIVDCAIQQGKQPMRYLILLLAVRDEFVLATLGAPLEHFEAVTPRELLLGVLDSIDNL